MLLMRWCFNDKCSVFCHLCGVQPVFSLALIALSFLDRLQLRKLLPPAVEEGELKRSWKPRTIEKSPISSCSRAKVLFHIIVLHKAHLMTIQCFCLIQNFSRFTMEILSFCHGNLNLTYCPILKSFCVCTKTNTIIPIQRDWFVLSWSPSHLVLVNELKDTFMCTL